MDTALLILVSLVGAVALALYMDWLGLWVSKKEMKEQIDGAKETRQALGKEIEDKACETAAQAKEGARIEASGKAVAFDLDAASLISLREALPGWCFASVESGRMLRAG
jgi:hypothetical protein